jgi:hypothetical protein
MIIQDTRERKFHIILGIILIYLVLATVNWSEVRNITWVSHTYFGTKGECIIYTLRLAGSQATNLQLNSLDVAVKFFILYVWTCMMPMASCSHYELVDTIVSCRYDLRFFWRRACLEHELGNRHIYSILNIQSPASTN